MGVYNMPVNFRRGHILQPISGTTHWGPAGENLGVWGVDKPAQLQLLLSDGAVRPMTPKEVDLFDRLNGGSP